MLSKIISIVLRSIKWLLRLVLPSNRMFWSAYAPFINALEKSVEYDITVKAFISYLNPNKQQEWLDAGSGDGLFISRIADKIAHIVGIDATPQMIEQANKRLARVRNANLRQIDLNVKLPFASGSFDRISSLFVLGYLSNRDTALNELCRVLKPGGIIAVATAKKGAKFLKILQAEVTRKRAEGTFRQNLHNLPSGIAAITFGKIAELKEWIGEYYFYEQKELENEFIRRGMEIIASFYSYGNQAIVVIAKKI